MKRKRDLMHVYDVLISEEVNAITSIYEDNKQYFDIAVGVLRLAYKILPLGGDEIKNDLHSHVQRTLLALYTAVFRFFRSIIILGKSGMDLEALVQLRSLLDTATYLLYIAEEDHENRLKRYLHSRALSLKTGVGRFVKTFPDENPYLNMEWYDTKYEEALKYFKSNHGEAITLKDIKKKYAIRPDTAAQEIKDKIFILHYNAFHPHASALSHGESILDYISGSEEPNKFILYVNPMDKWAQFCLIHSTVFMFLSIKRMNELLKLGKDIAVKNMDEKLGAFVETNYTKPAEEAMQKRHAES